MKKKKLYPNRELSPETEIEEYYKQIHQNNADYGKIIEIGDGENWYIPEIVTTTKENDGYITPDELSIGCTERGDPSLSYLWLVRLNEVDGAILATKYLTDKFINRVLTCNKNGLNLIIHCNCTGYGSTLLEPNAPPYYTQLKQFKKIIDKGFPAERTVLAIDPIFPSQKGLQRVNEVLSYAFDNLKIPTKRIRISLVDEYKTVRDRYKDKGWKPLYNGQFQPSKQQLLDVTKTLKPWYNKLHIKFELCAEEELFKLSDEIYDDCGCISEKDLEIFKIRINRTPFFNKQFRKGCHCLDCKEELLDYISKCRCNYGCVYCYWHGNTGF